MNPNHDEYGRFAAAQAVKEIKPPRKLNYEQHKRTFLGDIDVGEKGAHQLHKVEGGYKVMRVESGYAHGESDIIPEDLARTFIRRGANLEVSGSRSVRQYKTHRGDHAPPRDHH